MLLLSARLSTQAISVFQLQYEWFVTTFIRYGINLYNANQYLPKHAEYCA